MIKIEEAIEKMNEYGREKKPFLFVIDYEMLKPQIILIEHINSQKIFFDIDGYTNKVVASPTNEAINFKKNPIQYKEFKNAFDKVMQQIHFGNTYLTNLTFQTQIETNYSLLQIFQNSFAKYKLFIDNEFVVFSPETFIKIHHNKISSFPMKGTIDEALPNAKETLLNDHKEKAEHATIVDLIRNDLSRVATDVHVKRYRYIERIKTHAQVLLQTSSEIEGILPQDYHQSIGDVLYQLLPAGSICGAPKHKTLEVIRTVENQERGYYTGVFGYFDGEQLDSAVMIRYIEQVNGNLRYRSGGGITSFSNPESEYQEMKDKVYVPVY